MNRSSSPVRCSAPHRLTVAPPARDFRLPARPMAAPTLPALHWPVLLRQLGRRLQRLGPTVTPAQPAWC